MIKEKSKKGSGNIFADINIKNAEEWQCKAKLAAEIIAIIKDKEWTQTESAKYLGIKQVEISNINRGQFDRFKIDRLIHYLTKLNKDVQILVKPCQNQQPGHLSVICAV